MNRWMRSKIALVVGVAMELFLLLPANAAFEVVGHGILWWHFGSDVDPGCIMSWEVDEVLTELDTSSIDYGMEFVRPCDAICTVYRDGVAIAEVSTEGKEITWFTDYDVVPGSNYVYIVSAFGEYTSPLTNKCSFVYQSEIGADEISFGAEGGRDEVSVLVQKVTASSTSFAYWSNPTSSVEWLSAEIGEGWRSVVISADANDTEVAREGVVIIPCPGAECQITVKQAAKEKNYTVTFDANGGGGDEMEPQVFVADAPQMLRENTLNPPSADETFVGWALTWDGEVVYADKQSIVVSSNMTLYARWSGSYDDGGSGDSGSVTPGPETPGCEVVAEKDIVAPYDVPKAMTLQGAVYDGCDVVGIVELKLGKVKKGTGKVSGSVKTLDGKKHTAKGVNVTGINGTAPATVSLEVKDLGTMTVTIGGTQFAGTIGGSRHVQMSSVGGAWKGGVAVAAVEPGGLSAFSGTVLADLLPTDEVATVKNGKWTFLKAASVKWTKPKKGAALPVIYDEASGKGLVIDDSNGKTNLSGLKLTYTPKKGTFKGSFKVYALVGSGSATKLQKYKISVSGVVVGGVGYGTATCKKPSLAWPITVE